MLQGAACQALVAPAGRRCVGDSGPGVRRVLAVRPPARYLGSTGSRASATVRRPEGDTGPARQLRVVLAEATRRGIGARLTGNCQASRPVREAALLRCGGAAWGPGSASQSASR